METHLLDAITAEQLDLIHHFALLSNRGLLKDLLHLILGLIVLVLGLSNLFLGYANTQKSSFARRDFDT